MRTKGHIQIVGLDNLNDYYDVSLKKVTFPNALSAEDDLALLASVRECTKNGVTEPKEGFYQYSAAWDSKHMVTLEDGKSARVLFELQQMTDGGVSI